MQEIALYRAQVAEMAGQVIQRHAMPVSMAEMDVDVFLREMYAAQR